ncbi:MAG: hypothetical protein AB7E80_14585 [Hyphomicrobiaceae bacterium]
MSSNLLLGPVVIRSDDSPRNFIDRYQGLHALVPIFSVAGLVLATCTFIFLPIAPRVALTGVTWMTAIMIVAAALGLLSPLFRRDIVEATFDEGRKMALLVRRGPFAYSVWSIPFSRMAGARMATSYDAMGNKRMWAVLDLVDGRSLTLPSGTRFEDIEPVREMLQRAAPPKPLVKRPLPTVRAAR